MFLQPYTFLRRSGGWYIDLPEYLALGGNPEDLQMVAGSDDVLDLFAEHRSSVSLLISDLPFEDADHLQLSEPGGAEEGGAYYHLGSLEGRRLNQVVWLCNVLLFVFGRIPKDIYIKRAEDEKLSQKNRS